MTYSQTILGFLISFLCLACGEQKSKESKETIQTVQLLPRLKIDKDTIYAGDSLVATLSIAYQPMLSKQQKKGYIKSLGYYLDTASGIGYPQQVTDFTYKIEPDVTLDSVHIGFIPNYVDLAKDTIIKRDFSAAIKLRFPKVGGTTIDTIFMVKQTYYMKLKN